MDRNKRTAVVVSVAVLLAAVASLGMYRVVSRMPAKPAEVSKTVDVVVAQHPLKLGTRLTEDHVKVVKWPANDTGREFVRKDRGRRQPRPDRAVDENEPLTEVEAGAARGGRRPAAVDPARHARHLGQGQRSDRRRRLRRARHPRRRHGRRCRAQERGRTAMTRVVVSNVQVLTAGTRYDQEKRERRQADPFDGRHAAGPPEDARAHRAGGVRGPDHADAPQSAGSQSPPRPPECGPRALLGQRRRRPPGKRQPSAPRRRRKPLHPIGAGSRRRRSTPSRPFRGGQANRGDCSMRRQMAVARSRAAWRHSRWFARRWPRFRCRRRAPTPAHARSRRRGSRAGGSTPARPQFERVVADGRPLDGA